jgi:hypothetical protein
MAKIKYILEEFTPKENQNGSHSVYATALINNTLYSPELCQQISARTGFKSYECFAVIAAAVDIIFERVVSGDRVILTNEQGMKLVSIYPKVTGGLSDKEVQENPEKYNGASVATPEMVTQNMLSWKIGATVGIKISKLFALTKSAQRVKSIGNGTIIIEDDDDVNDGTTPNPNPDNNGGGGTDSNPDGIE